MFTPAPRQIRVHLIQRNVFFRKILIWTCALNRDIELSGTSSLGKAGIESIRASSPDVILLDGEFSQEKLEEFLDTGQSYDFPGIIVTCPQGRRHSPTVEMCMTRGASELLEYNPGLLDLALGLQENEASSGQLNTAVSDAVKNYLLEKDIFQTFQSKLVSRIRACSALKISRAIKALTRNSLHQGAPAQNEAPLQQAGREKATITEKILCQSRFLITAIGVSTGGPEALLCLLRQFASPPPLPVIIAIHMPSQFTEALASSLRKQTSFSVSVPHHSQELLPGEFYIAPGGKHAQIVMNRRGNLEFREINDRRGEAYIPSVDLLFRSVATACGDKSMAVVLTGMGQDGLKGARLIHEKGGTLLAQDQESSLIWGMPGAVVGENLAHRVVSLDKMGSVIVKLATLK